MIGWTLIPKTNIRTKTWFLSWSMTFDYDDPGGDPMKVIVLSQFAGGALAPALVFTLGRYLIALLTSWGVVLHFG